MRSLLRSFLIVFLLVPVYAAQKEMSIVVGTYQSKTTADAELQALKDVMSDVNIVDLRETNGFGYSLQRVGKYNRVVIAPFKDKRVLQRMLYMAREHYRDAYVLSGKTGSVALKVPVETEAQREERIAAADMAFDEEIEDTLPIVPYFSQSVSSKVSEKVEKTVVKTDWSEHIKDEKSMFETASGAVATRPGNSDLTLYAVIGVLLIIIVLGGILLWRKKRVKRRRRTHRDVVDIGVPPVAGHTSRRDS